MIKTIKKIDLHGNEVWQEVIVCNRCKRTLESKDFVYETNRIWTAWHPVRMEPGCAYGFAGDSNPVKHICEDCKKKVEDFLDGKNINEETNKSHLTTFRERVQDIAKDLRDEPTSVLREFRSSFACGMETAAAIDLILKERKSL
jgi:hypothetical protein